MASIMSFTSFLIPRSAMNLSIQNVLSSSVSVPSISMRRYSQLAMVVFTRSYALFSLFMFSLIHFFPHHGAYHQYQRGQPHYYDPLPHIINLLFISHSSDISLPAL